jgi:hypothetical protein
LLGGHDRHHEAAPERRRKKSFHRRDINPNAP